MNVQNTQPSPAEAEEPVKRWWIESWPVLIPLVLIGGLLWFGLWYSRRAQLLEDAGYVVFNAPTWSLIEQWGGPEMRSLIGSPTSLHIGGEHPTSSQLRIIGGFTELTDLAVRGLKDSDLESLTGCDKLEILHLEQSSITDAGCETLARLPRLTDIYLETDQSISVAGMSAIASLTSLQSLNVTSPGMSEDVLPPLAKLRNLVILDLTRVRIDGDGLRHIAQLPRLKGLGLSECQISPAALKPLANATGSLRLILNGSTITDEHLEVLGNVPWLSCVSCETTQVTPAGCEQFAQDHPGVTIVDADWKQHLVEFDYDTLSDETESSGIEIEVTE